MPRLVINHIETDKCSFLHTNYLLNFFSANLFEETAAETHRYISKNPYNMNCQSAKLPALSHQEFHKEMNEGLVGDVPNKMT
jgi:hypothetical protein